MRRSCELGNGATYRCQAVNFRRGAAEQSGLFVGGMAGGDMSSLIGWRAILVIAASPTMRGLQNRRRSRSSIRIIICRTAVARPTCCRNCSPTSTPATTLSPRCSRSAARCTAPTGRSRCPVGEVDRSRVARLNSALKEAEFAATLPSSTYRTPSSRPICFASTGFKGGVAGNNEAGPPSRLKHCST